MHVSISELVYLSGKQSKRKKMTIFILIIVYLCFFVSKVEETCISHISYDDFIYVNKNELDHFILPILDSKFKTAFRTIKVFHRCCQNLFDEEC